VAQASSSKCQHHSALPIENQDMTTVLYPEELWIAPSFSVGMQELVVFYLASDLTLLIVILSLLDWNTKKRLFVLGACASPTKIFLLASLTPKNCNKEGIKFDGERTRGRRRESRR
jgi:hypothetical protein